jgi:hypothetical protein
VKFGVTYGWVVAFRVGRSPGESVDGGNS